VYKLAAAPPGWEHSAYYEKDATHALYRYVIVALAMEAV
jgi:hypothetical protein